MIRVVIELNLIFPYKISMSTLVEFCSLWSCTILYGGTKRLSAIISMPVNYFRVIFGTNPKEGKFSVPSGMGDFIESLKVKKVMVK